MSTKSTIAYGPGFHFYHEALDDDHVYLELTTTQFEAAYGSVMVPIPIHIWETIRHLGGAELDLVDKSDAGLLDDVEAEVDRRIEEYQRVLREHPDRAKLFALVGSLVFGSAEGPRDEQIESGMAWYLARRKHQQEIQSAIFELKAGQDT